MTKLDKETVEDKIIINVNEDVCVVSSPYNSYFVSGARRLAGKYSSGSNWVFPASQEERVRKLCQSVYGIDHGKIPTVTVRVQMEDVDRWEAGVEVVLCGRRVARVFDRDGGAKLSNNVVILSGGFGSGGSRKNPRITVENNTEIELLNVPVPMAEKLVNKGSKWVKSATVVKSVNIDIEELKAERRSLLSRLADIDVILNETINSSKESITNEQ